MSLLDYSEDPRLNPLDVVEGVAGTNNWSFERAGDEEITILVSGRWTDYQVSFTWMDDIEALHLACAFDLKVPDRRRAATQQLISRINEVETSLRIEFPDIQWLFFEPDNAD